MKYLRLRWAVSIAGLAVTSVIHAAEIDFEFHPIDQQAGAADTSQARPITARYPQSSEPDPNIVDLFTDPLPVHPDNQLPESGPDKDANPAVLTGPIAVRPAVSPNPIDHHFLGYLGPDLYSGYLFDSVAYWPATADEERRPHLTIERDEFQHSFILETSYVTYYWPEQGKFSWPVSLYMAAFDNSILTAEVNGAEAFAYLDSIEGYFRLIGQVKTSDGSALNLSLTSLLSLGGDVHPELINPLLSIQTGNAEEQLSVPELRLILTGNKHSDIAGQFNNFAYADNIGDILTIIGQFSSLSAPRK